NTRSLEIVDVGSWMSRITRDAAFELDVIAVWFVATPTMSTGFPAMSTAGPSLNRPTPTLIVSVGAPFASAASRASCRLGSVVPTQPGGLWTQKTSAPALAGTAKPTTTVTSAT